MEEWRFKPVVVSGGGEINPDFAWKKEWCFDFQVEVPSIAGVFGWAG